MGSRPEMSLAALLDAVETASPTAGVGALAHHLPAGLGAREVSLLVAHLEGGALERVVREPLGDAAAPGERPIEGTAAGRALRTQDVQVSREGDSWLVHAPVTERGEALGVLEVVLPVEPDREALAQLRSAGHALAFVLIAERRFTDVYETAARQGDISLAAEIQRRLLPSAYTCEAGPFTLAGWLVPAKEAGGDTFDYSVGQETLQVSVTDAMGHGLEAALLATLAVAALRNARRAGVSMPGQAGAANDALTQHCRTDQFVTGQLLRVDLVTGRAVLVNAGHVHPMRVRDGKVSRIPIVSDPPFGVVPDVAYRTQEVDLAPGDRVVLLTDGMEDRSAAGAMLPSLIRDLAGSHPREVVQSLASAVIDATGADLPDDATVVVLDWYGPDAQRDPVAGASRGRASR